MAGWPAEAFTMDVLERILRLLPTAELVRCARVAKPWLAAVDGICAGTELKRRFRSQLQGRKLVEFLLDAETDESQTDQWGSLTRKLLHRPMRAGRHSAEFVVTLGEDGGDGALMAILQRSGGEGDEVAGQGTNWHLQLPLSDDDGGSSISLSGAGWETVPHEAWSSAYRDLEAGAAPSLLQTMRTWFEQRAGVEPGNPWNAMHGTPPDDAWEYAIPTRCTVVADLDRRLVTVTNAYKRQYASPDNRVPADPISIKMPPAVAGETWRWGSYVSDMNAGRDDVTVECEPIDLSK